jgi:hypothetical protein
VWGAGGRDAALTCDWSLVINLWNNVRAGAGDMAPCVAARRRAALDVSDRVEKESLETSLTPCAGFSTPSLVLSHTPRGSLKPLLTSIGPLSNRECLVSAFSQLYWLQAPGGLAGLSM